MSKEKTYLKWYNKVGYGSGDVAGNVVYALLTSFVMIYLTDTIGLNAGVIGVLIAVSKIFDGITDIIFGTLIDKTHTKMGKAKPWMLYGFIGCAITLIGVFAIPMNMDNFAQYAWFFICYTLLNSVFYTANTTAHCFNKLECNSLNQEACSKCEDKAIRTHLNSFLAVLCNKSGQSRICDVVCRIKYTVKKHSKFSYTTNIM